MAVLCYDRADLKPEEVVKVFIALAAATIALSWSSIAAACQCKTSSDRDESYRSATYVFFGIVVSSDDGLKLKVKKNYKGTKAKRTHSITRASDCAFAFEEGKTYMVYAAKGEGKRAVAVDQCGASAQLDHQPMSQVVWSLADELAYKSSGSVAKRHKAGRDQLNARAIRKIQFAAKSCDAAVWKKTENVKARMEVRFDVEPDGKYTHELLKYETPTAASADVKKCLAEKLAEDDFKSFPGGRVSVSTYWIIDRLDATFGQDKDSATVLPFKSPKHLLE